MRLDGARQTAWLLGKSEGRRPARLERALDFVPAYLERQATGLARDTDFIKSWTEKDLKQWRDRQPIYLDRTGRILWGEPERLERSAAVLFF